MERQTNLKEEEEEKEDKEEIEEEEPGIGTACLFR